MIWGSLAVWLLLAGAPAAGLAQETLTPLTYPGPSSGPGDMPLPQGWVPLEWVPTPPDACPEGVCCEGPEVFARKQLSFQFLAGAYFSTGLGPETPEFNYLPVAFRFGCMLNDPRHDGTCLRGNWEVLLEGIVAPIVSGFGDILTGPSLLLRYNFIQPEARLVPYLQAGIGVVYTDAADAPNQRAIGQEVEFLLQAALGVRCFLGDNWTLDVEAGFQHISNADLADANGGINDFGASIGLTYFFPRRR